MQIILIRHGESEGNAEGRMQGHADFPLSERGRAQAEQLGGWLQGQGLSWDAAYCSPLLRASETAKIALFAGGGPEAEPWDALKEVDAGELSGLNMEEIVARAPGFMERGITTLGDFSEYGGESYGQVQERVAGIRARLVERHQENRHTVVLVAHGGLNFQLAKDLICTPVPTVCILRYGNCTTTAIRVRERRGTTIGEVKWHVPLELMGGAGGEGSAALFR